MEIKKIKDICNVTSSKRIFASDYVDSGIPFYRGKEITEFSQTHKITPEYFITATKYAEIQQKFDVPCKGDILITAVGTLGSLMLVNDPNFYFKDGNIIWLKNFNQLINSKYLFYYLGNTKVQKELINSAIGSTQKAFTIDMIKDFEISVPSLTEQQHIVNTIGSVDDLIENYQSRIVKIAKILSKSLEKYTRKTTIDYYKPVLIKSKIDKFDRNKEYLDTSSIDGINNISAGKIITYNQRPSRANMQPVKESVWFAKMKGSYKNLVIGNNDADIIDSKILSTGFQGIKASKDLPLSLLTAFIISSDFNSQRDLNSVGTTMAGVNNYTFMKINVPLLSKSEIHDFENTNRLLIDELSILRRKINSLKKQKLLLLSKCF